MGIKGNFNDFLKKKKVNHKTVAPLKKFSGKRVTIDSGIWLYSNMATATKNYVNYMKDPLEKIDTDKLFMALVRNFLSFNSKFLDEKVTPVWIWDGNKQGGHKGKEREKRQDKKENDKRLKKELEEILREQNPLLRSDLHIKKYKDLLCRICFLNSEMIQKIKKLCTLLGIPNIQAEGEAENMAASLVVEGLAKGVWTKDTDVFPMMPKYVLGSFSEIDGIVHIEVSLPIKACEALELDAESFRDFCIMCGTDFNDNIPKYGPINSYKLIKEYKRIEHIKLKEGECKDCLNVEICRELLSPFETGFIDKEHELEASVPSGVDIEEIETLFPFINPIDVIRGIHYLKK